MPFIVKKVRKTVKSSLFFYYENGGFVQTMIGGYLQFEGGLYHDETDEKRWRHKTKREKESS